MIGIYKITNIVNLKSYIGQSIHIEKRMQEHKSIYNWNREKNKILYIAFQKYGLNNFKFEILEECDRKELSEREKFYIEKYNTYKKGYNETIGGETNEGENHPGHKLTENDVIDIRTRYKNLERKRDVYLDYAERIGESGFSKIWNGETWKTIMIEVYTDDNKNFHANNTSNAGSKNGRSRLSEQDVKDIRLRRKNGENIRDVYKKYQDKLTYGSFTNVWTYQNWKNIIV